MSLVKFLNDLEQNPELKKKVGIALGVSILAIFCLGYFLLQSIGENDERLVEKRTNNIEGSHLKGDTVGIEVQKENHYFQFSSKSDSVDFSAINNSASMGADANKVATESTNEDISNYLQARQQSVNRMQNSSNRPTVSSSGGGGGGRRSYNSYGNSNDWTSSNTNTTVSGTTTSYSNDDIEAELERRLPSSQVSNNRPTMRNNSVATNVVETPKTLQAQQNQMSDTERRRQMLRTGKRDVGNSQQIKFNVDGTQHIKNGGTIKLKTMEDSFIGGQHIPKYTVIYGNTSFGSERLNITINSFKLGNKIVNCNLEGYSTDGLQGIAVSLNNLSGVTDQMKNEAMNEASRQMGGATGILGRVVTGLLNSGRSRSSEIKVKVLNNQELIFVQK